MNSLRNRGIEKEAELLTSTSSGPGGQHVNKTQSRVTLKFSVRNSTLLTEEEKVSILSKLANQLTREAEIVVSASESRSQIRNRILAADKLIQMLDGALQTKKARKKTWPTRASKEKRLNKKKIRSEIKANRRKDSFF
jgi:ribosome-associated protein